MVSLSAALGILARLYLWAEAKECADIVILELNILLRRPDDVPYLNVNVF